VSVEPLGCFLVGGVGYGADFERTDAIERSSARRHATFPCNARGTRLIANRLGALRCDDILITASDHIEGDMEAAHALCRATQGDNRGSMAGKTWRRARRKQQAVIMLHCLRPNHDVANR